MSDFFNVINDNDELFNSIFDVYGLDSENRKQILDLINGVIEKSVGENDYISDDGNAWQR